MLLQQTYKIGVIPDSERLYIIPKARYLKSINARTDISTYLECIWKVHTLHWTSGPLRICKLLSDLLPLYLFFCPALLQSLIDPHVINQFAKALYRVAQTGYLNNRNLLSDSSRGQKSMIKVLAQSVPFKKCEGKICSKPFSLAY